MRPSTDLSAPDSLVDLPCACATVRRAARAVTQLYVNDLRTTEIEGTQFTLLSVLSSLGPCNQAAICERFALDKTTLSRNLKLLKNKGWIEAAEPADGRERRYVLTAAGGKRSLWPPGGVRRRISASMSEKEDAMWKVFRTLTTASTPRGAARRQGVRNDDLHDCRPGACERCWQHRQPRKRRRRRAFRSSDAAARSRDELALNAAPKHLRDDATVLVLDSTGYVKARRNQCVHLRRRRRRRRLSRVLGYRRREGSTADRSRRCQADWRARRSLRSIARSRTASRAAVSRRHGRSGLHVVADALSHRRAKVTLESQSVMFYGRYWTRRSAASADRCSS
jgi:hypothetical protein